MLQNKAGSGRGRGPEHRAQQELGNSIGQAVRLQLWPSQVAPQLVLVLGRLNFNATTYHIGFVIA